MRDVWNAWMNPRERMSLSAVILAGGQSRRMGRDKAWIEQAGQPLIALAVGKARQLGLTDVFISGRPDVEYSALGCPILLDLAPGFGPLGGIERGLHECSSALLLVLAVDLPHMTVEFLRKLVGRCDRLTGVVPQLDGEPEPLAAIYPKRCHMLVREAVTRSRRAARDFVAACLKERAVRMFPVAAGDALCFANWNRPTDVPSAPPASAPMA
jgi:molybdopterin-guanine dinucleotide biosynthesis protein A